MSSFGFSGTNAHILLSEAEPVPPRAPASEPCLITVSARSAAGLARRLADLRAWLQPNTADLRDIARTLNAGRCHFEHRWAAIVASQADLKAALDGGSLDATGGRYPALVAAAEAYRGTGDIGDDAIPSAGRRISLPTYPFEMRRYWLDRSDAPAAVPAPAVTAARATYFVPAWTEAPLPNAMPTGPLWIVNDVDGVGAKLAQAWRAAGVRVTELRPTDLADVAAICRREGAPDAVLYLAGPESDGQVRDLFTLAQGLFTERSRILVVHRGQPIQESLQALRRSLHFDGATVDLRTLGLPAALPFEMLAAHVAAELAAPRGTETEAAIRDGRRMVRRMVAAEPPRSEVALRSGRPLRHHRRWRRARRTVRPPPRRGNARPHHAAWPLAGERSHAGDARCRRRWHLSASRHH